MKLLRLFWLAPMLGLFIQCKKITDIQQSPLLDTTLINAMYPVTRSYTDGGYFRSYKYEYNNDHHLSKYTLGNTVTWTVGTNQVDVTINEYASSNQELIHISTTSYVYTLAGVPTNTSVNIYNTAPTHVAWTYYDKDMPNGVTKSRPGGVSEFFTNKEGLPCKAVTALPNAYTTTSASKKSFMTKVNPYLFFNGNCEEVFTFYKSVFRREFNYLGRYKDVPTTDRHLFKENDEKIMHVTLPISEETTLMGSDSTELDKEPGSHANFALYINTESRDEAERLFHELSVGGQIRVAMTETFWGSYYGIFKDKFGINWKITFDLP